MCAIFGSSNLDRFYELYEANKQRGSFSLGCLVAHGLHKQTSVFHDYKIIKDTDIERGLKSLEQYRYMLPTYFVGHIQAPTGIDRFTESSIHPFTYGDWVVAHNGVLTNFVKLKQQHGFTDHVSNVDSSIIPRLLDKYESDKPHSSFKKTFSELNGTFSTWMYNKKNFEFFICRLSSTLFFKGDEFSSVCVGDMVEVPEKRVYWLLSFTDKTNNKFLHVDSFDAESHFFTF